MGIEFFLIGAGIAILVTVIARRRILERRLLSNRDKLVENYLDSEIPLDFLPNTAALPLLKGSGKFELRAIDSIDFSENFEKVRLQRHLFFAESTELECVLIPDPANLLRKLAVSVTVDGLILGFVPDIEAEQMHKYLLSHKGGIRAKAKIFLGSRPMYNELYLDISKPLRLELSLQRKK
jgi:hypothetical protein